MFCIYVNIVIATGSGDRSTEREGDDSSDDGIAADWLEAIRAGEKSQSEKASSTSASSRTADPSTTPKEDVTSGSKTRTVDKYPRLQHPMGGPDDHFIRLVENDVLNMMDMRAVCCMHANCTLNRQSKKRPLAMLWAWLDSADQFTTKEAHKLKGNMPSHERRAAARQGLREMPEARPWFDAEKRARRAAGLQHVDSDVEEQPCP